MKKLIAISVMCALVAGAAFADTSVGGQVFVAGALAKGDNIEGSTVDSNGIHNDQYNTALKINFSEGNAGGRIRILGNGSNSPDGHGGGLFDEWFGWWRPTDFLRIKIGNDRDGEYGTANISGWGFTGESKNNSGMQGAMGEYSGYGEGRNHSRSTGWYNGNGGTPAINFNLYPVEWLAVNLWFPWTGRTNNDQSANALVSLAKVNLNLNITAGDYGKLNVSYEGNTGYLSPLAALQAEDPDAKTPWYGDAGVTDAANSPKAYLSFYSSDFFTLVDGFGFDIGLAYKFPFNDTDVDLKTNHPFEIGLGLRYGVGDFNVKLRGAVSLGASTVLGEKNSDYDKEKSENNTVKGQTEISLNILPSYKVGNVTIYLYGGIGIRAIESGEWEKQEGTMYANAGKDAIIAWFVNPYVFIPTSGGLRFKVGLQVYSSGEPFGSAYYKEGEKQFPDAKIEWRIPFGFYTYF